MRPAASWAINMATSTMTAMNIWFTASRAGAARFIPAKKPRPEPAM